MLRAAGAATRCGRVPTPLEPRADMSKDLGVELLLKREDLLDDLGCGHKARKLHYHLAEALRLDASVLLTVGSLPSSQSVAVAAAARRCGIRAHLLYMGDEQAQPATAHGYYLLASLLGPTITWHERRPWAEHAAALQDAVQAEIALGETPYPIPPGMSSGPGLLGSIELGLELAAQLGSSATRPTHIVAPAGSGGTCLGLAIAAVALELDWRVTGVCIGASARAVEDQVASLCQEAGALAWAHSATNRVTFHDHALGGGYAQTSRSQLELVRDALRCYGLLFDPVYMIKALLGIRQLIELGTICSTTRTLLVHTGGSLGVLSDIRTPL